MHKALFRCFSLPSALCEQYTKRALNGESVQFTAKVDKSTQVQTEHYQINYIPQITELGHVEGYFSIYQNITQNVSAENVLKQTNEDLEERVHERTQDLRKA